MLLVTTNIPRSPIVTLMMEAMRSTETSVLNRATRRSIPEEYILSTFIFLLTFPRNKYEEQ
jgi:hypothetical protein